MSQSDPKTTRTKRSMKHFSPQKGNMSLRNPGSSPKGQRGRLEVIKEMHVLDTETQEEDQMGFKEKPEIPKLKFSIMKANSSRQNIDVMALITEQREQYLSKRGALYEGEEGLTEEQILRSSSRNLRTVDSSKVEKLIKANFVSNKLENLKYKFREEVLEVKHRNGEYYSSLVTLKFTLLGG